MFPVLRLQSIFRGTSLLVLAVGCNAVVTSSLCAAAENIKTLSPTAKTAAYPNWIWGPGLLVILIIVIISGILWNRALQIRVAAQTRELARELGARTEAEERILVQNQEMNATNKALQSSYGTVALMAKELAASQKNLLEINSRLESSNALYRSLFNNSLNPILILDGSNLRILDANLASQRISGYTLEEFREMSLLNLAEGTLPEGTEIVAQEHQKTIRDGIATFKVTPINKYSEPIPMQVQFVLVPHNDTELLLCTIQDLREQIKREQDREKLIRYQQEAQKMTTLSIMSAGVVHEIAQPLNAINILAEGMIFWRDNGRPVDLNECFDTFQKISTQAERINDVIVHMRDLANAFNESELVPCSVNEAINGAVMMLGSQLASHGIELGLDLDPTLPLVLGQIQRFEEIILNLITNAMRALNDQADVRRIICSTSQENGQVFVEISDSGPGISPEIAEHIWEPFFSTRMNGESMGLGLVIVHSIVSRLGGTINYSQNYLGGATFKIVLPSADHAEAAYMQ